VGVNIETRLITPGASSRMTAVFYAALLSFPAPAAQAVARAAQPAPRQPGRRRTPFPRSRLNHRRATQAWPGRGGKIERN